MDLEMFEITDIQKVVVTVAADCKVSEAVIIALEKFNTELDIHNIELPLNTDLYAPRLPKKNGRPKLDLPSLDYKQKMFDTKVTVVSIQIKDKEALLRVKHELASTEKDPSSTRLSSDMRFGKK
jgi:hypothetical protein